MSKKRKSKSAAKDNKPKLKIAPTKLQEERIHTTKSKSNCQKIPEIKIGRQK